MTEHVFSPTHKLTEEELFCLQGCRSFKQYFEMRKTFESNFCRFCNLDRNKNSVVWEDEHAWAWPVPEQYLRKEELKYHLIIAPKRHVRFLQELSESEILSMHAARCTLSTRYDLVGGIHATRFGSMMLNAGTVPHIHENIYVPSGAAEFRVPVFKDSAHANENKARTAGFAQRFCTGEVP